MPSQHRHPVHGFRPDPGEYEAARGQLEARGHTVGVYLRACLRWLARDPEAALAALTVDWPGQRPLGRPLHDGDSSAAGVGAQGSTDC